MEDGVRPDRRTTAEADEQVPPPAGSAKLPSPPRAAAPGVYCPIDADLSTIILKALTKERDRRYETAGQFARDVRRYLADEPIAARPPTAWYQLRMFARRHRAVAGAMLSVFVVLVAAVVLTTWELGQLRAANRVAMEAKEAMGNSLAVGGDDQADHHDLFAARRVYMRALEEAGIARGQWVLHSRGAARSGQSPRRTDTPVRDLWL